MILSGWGRFPRQDCYVTRPRSEAGLRARIIEGGLIARGNGRAYGDSALSARNTVDMRGFNRMLAFNAETGQLVTEAGVLLADVISVFLTRGWFPSVTPGTKFVTIGGMIAADVHGKNHHKHGSFGAFVDWIDVMDTHGEVRRCAPDRNPDLFQWTLGGMGLTGIILRAAFRLRPVETAWIRQTLIPAPNLAAAMEIFEAKQDATYSVAWIDCLAPEGRRGRSLVMLGEHAPLDTLPADRKNAPFETPRRRKFTIPFDAPSLALNRLTAHVFNDCYYRNGLQKAGTSLIDWDSYFYPLDSILGWNRLYGRRGLAQFQCVLPLDTARKGLERLLGEISASGQGSFLAVLKRFGAQESRFSFPMEGYTLALDFPANTKALALMERLDLIAVAHGGRFYLAKDSRMSRATLDRSDPRVKKFRAMREEVALKPSFQSTQSERLGL
jgi:FAD/FMN-containing dehydrogenase